MSSREPIDAEHLRIRLKFLETDREHRANDMVKIMQRSNNAELKLNELSSVVLLTSVVNTTVFGTVAACLIDGAHREPRINIRPQLGGALIMGAVLMMTVAWPTTRII